MSSSGENTVDPSDIMIASSGSAPATTADNQAETHSSNGRPTVRMTEPLPEERYHHDSGPAPEESATTIFSEFRGPPCSNCQQAESQYQSDPCRCLYFCKKCAMKMATGGKCRHCHQLYSTMVLSRWRERHQAWFIQLTSSYLLAQNSSFLIVERNLNEQHNCK